MSTDDLFKTLSKGFDSLNWNSVKSKIKNALEEIIPFKFDLKDSIEEKALVFEEIYINQFLAQKTVKIQELDYLEIKFYEKNIIEVIFIFNKLGLKNKVKQKMEIISTEIDNENAFLKLKLLEKPNIEANSFISKIFMAIFQDRIKDSIPDYIHFYEDNQNISLDLKKLALEKLYKKNLNELITKIPTPFIGQKKLFDVIQIKSVSTKDSKILINFRLNLF